MAIEDQRQPDHSDLLSEEHVRSAADFNREMQILSWRYRMQEVAAGVWTLIDTSSSTVLHHTPRVGEAMAVHIFRAWIYGYIHDGNFSIIGQYLIGNLPDDANPY